ncbi:uncharacterized protein [Nicotiana tomentosiformis]|uniref:uncharacterized protein n=1 Tax=Nicotiana tomentosiformis TaxID=4098 RepID=UPI00388C7F12
MKSDVNIWTHKVPQDCSWYWRKLNSLKEEMKSWYQGDTCKLSVNGNYSITRSYIAIKGPHKRWPTTDLLWNAIAQPKHRIIMWLAAQGRPLTKARLSTLHIHVDEDKCALCDNQEVKTNQHLFVECQWSKDVRDTLMHWVGIQMQPRDIQRVLYTTKRKKWQLVKKEVVAASWAAIVYHIWKAKN